MCSSKSKATSLSSSTDNINPNALARINGRPVLQANCNRIPTLDRRNSLKKITPKTALPAPPPVPPPPGVSPKSRSPRPQAPKRGNDVTGLSISSEKVLTPRTTPTLERKKSKKFSTGDGGYESTNSTIESALSYSSSLILDSPGSIATIRREQVALLQAQRKMKIAHYGRSKSAKFESKYTPLLEEPVAIALDEDKRCSFITANSDPLYVAYHDEEWGVPVHDDKMLFELLVLSGAQVGSDWTAILKKRQDFRSAFSDFDAEIISRLTEKQMVSVSEEYGIEISRVRGVVDNSKRILEIKKQFGSLDKYIWEFVNNKPICTQYKSCLKIPVKTSKSESISKDMVRRGFRYVGPTVVHSFMQAAGLTNDHLITCHRHHQCSSSSSDHILATTFCS